MNEDLRKWFRDKWVRMDTKGNIKGDCAREEGEGKPKCLPLAKARSMNKQDRATAAQRKRREDPVADRSSKGGKPVNVTTEETSTSELIKKSHSKRGSPGTLKAKINGPITLEKVKQLKNRPNATTLDKKQANFYINMHSEEYLEEKNAPTNPELWSKAKSLARQKFDVYPSAYANGWAAKWYKSKGGGWKSIQEEKPMKTLKQILEGTVVMSDFKLDKKGRKYKAHRSKMKDDQDMANVKEAKDPREYDYEGDMAKSQLRSIIANAKQVHDMLKDDTNMAEWVQSKITLAADYITTVADYMQAEVNEDKNDYQRKIEKNNKNFIAASKRQKNPLTNVHTAQSKMKPMKEDMNPYNTILEAQVEDPDNVARKNILAKFIKKATPKSATTYDLSKAGASLAEARGRPAGAATLAKRAAAAATKPQHDDEEGDNYGPDSGVEADQHIHVQLKKAADSDQKPFEVSFKNGKKHAVSQKVAKDLLSATERLKPEHRNNVHNEIHQSYDNLISVHRLVAGK